MAIERFYAYVWKRLFRGKFIQIKKNTTVQLT